jgi:RimJ/RimL family protein N-acetyltransferase
MIMSIYKVLKRNEFTRNRYSISPLREQDIYEIKTWRNEQRDILRQNAVLTDQHQIAYYQNHVVPSFSDLKPTMILFSFLGHSHCIGYGGLANIDWENRRAELSFLLETKRAGNPEQYREDFSAFLHLMKDVAFTELPLNRIFTETYDIRPEHVSVLEQNGFMLEGRLRQHVFIRGRFVDSLIHGCLKEPDHA